MSRKKDNTQKTTKNIVTYISAHNNKKKRPGKKKKNDLWDEPQT